MLKKEANPQFEDAGTIQRRILWGRIKYYCGDNSVIFDNTLKQLEAEGIIECGKFGRLSCVRLLVF